MIAQQLHVLMNPLTLYPHTFLRQSRTKPGTARRTFRVLFPSWSPRVPSRPALFSSLQVNLALKQKSDIEHYRNKLRLKAKRKGYYDFPSTDGSSGSRVPAQRQRHGHERAAGEHGRPLEPDDERGSTYVKSHRRWEWKSKWNLGVNRKWNPCLHKFVRRRGHSFNRHSIGWLGFSPCPDICNHWPLPCLISL